MNNLKYKKSFVKNQTLNKQMSKMTETYQNQNIYQGEFDYRMTNSLKFEQENDENNCQRSVFIRYLDSLHAIILYSILKNIYDMSVEWNFSYGYFFLRIFTITCLMICFLIISNIDSFINNLIHLRWFMEIDSLVSLYIFARTSEFSYVSIAIKILQSSILNFLFNLNINQAVTFYYVEALICLLFMGYPDSIFISRFVYNISSFNGLYIVFVAFFHFFCYYFLLKSQRELWALYDSFRRSFFTMKTICDEIPFPILIVNRKKQTNPNQTINYTYQSYYKNTEALKLYMKIKKLRGENSKQAGPNRTGVKSDFNFKDLFEKKVEKLLDSEIEKCLTNDTNYFDFPLIIGDEPLGYKISENFPTIYEGNLAGVKWVRIIISPTMWKGLDCLMIQIMEDNDKKYNYFLEEYERMINNEFIKTLDNVDIICDRAPELKKREERKSPISTHVHSRKNSGVYENTIEMAKTPEVKNRVLNKSPVMQAHMFNKTPEKNSPEKLSKFLQVPKNPFGNEGMSKGNLAMTSMPKIEVNNNPFQTEKNQFDYSLLFFMKNSLNYLYDMYLTINTLNSLRINKTQNKLTQFNFEKFVFYLVDYFHPFLKIKNIKVKLVNQIEEVNSVYDYYRVIFFNTLLFIINNTETKEVEQEIVINADHLKYEEQGGSYYEIVFNITDDNPNIKYNLVAEFLSSFKVTELRNYSIENYKIIDVGLVVSSHIVNSIYNSEFKITSTGNKHKISFVIYSHEVENTQITKKFYKRSSEIEEKYYTGLVNLYQNNKTSKSFLKQDSGQPNRKNQKILSQKQVENDGNDSEEDVFYTLQTDINQYKELHISMNNNFDFEDKLLIIPEYKNKFQNIKNNSSKLKTFTKGSGFGNRKSQTTAKWDNSSMINNIKYCPVPRFLIVEDNIVGRMSIKDELKRLKLEHRYDIAADGREAVYKFKILLNQGYMFDFIFMDIYLPEMGGVEATKNIRGIESTYNVHSNIVAVTVEGKKELEEGVFDDYFEKPIKNSDKFFSYISKHFKKNRPDITLKEIKV